MGLKDWSIDVDEARAVVTTTKGHFDKIDQLKVDATTAVAEAMTAVDNFEIGEALSTTLNEYLAIMLGSAEAIGDNICLKMHEAINAYVDGDAEIAVRAEASTAGIPDEDPEKDKSTPVATQAGDGS